MDLADAALHAAVASRSLWLHASLARETTSRAIPDVTSLEGSLGARADPWGGIRVATSGC